jgi:hypothetical protein
MLSDDGYSDDALIIDVDPAKLDLHHLIYAVIPVYIQAFDAYRVDYYDEQFVDLAYKARDEEELNNTGSRENINPRFKVERVNVVSFYDELLCRRACNLSLSDISERLQAKAEHAQLLHGGVYVVGASRLLPFDEAMDLCRKMGSAVLGHQNSITSRDHS